MNLAKCYLHVLNLWSLAT